MVIKEQADTRLGPHAAFRGGGIPDGGEQEVQPEHRGAHKSEMISTRSLVSPDSSIHPPSLFFQGLQVAATSHSSCLFLSGFFHFPLSGRLSFQ